MEFLMLKAQLQLHIFKSMHSICHPCNSVYMYNSEINHAVLSDFFNNGSVCFNYRHRLNSDLRHHANSQQKRSVYKERFCMNELIVISLHTSTQIGPLMNFSFFWYSINFFGRVIITGAYQTSLTC